MTSGSRRFDEAGRTSAEVVGSGVVAGVPFGHDDERNFGTTTIFCRTAVAGEGSAGVLLGGFGSIERGLQVAVTRPAEGPDKGQRLSVEVEYVANRSGDVSILGEVKAVKGATATLQRLSVSGKDETGLDGTLTAIERRLTAVSAVFVLAAARRRRALAVALCLLVAPTASCATSKGHQVTAAPTPGAAALLTHTDSAFSLGYPAGWTYREGSSPYGIYNNFIGPKGPSGYEPSILVGRTEHADAQTFADGITLFQTIHPDRKLEPEVPITVKGAQKATLIRSTSTFKGTPLTSWNVFVLTPSAAALNLEFVAPTAAFDTATMQRLLATLVAR